MKQSLFNHMTELPDGSFGLYNFLSGNYFRMNFFTRDYYDHPELYGREHPFVAKLIQKGFLTDYDELAYLKHRVAHDCGNTKELQLTICPTLQCNFSCSYCYETPRSGKMSEETQDAVVEFARRMLELYDPKKLSVVWYGGEPLLEKGIIEHLSMKLIQLAEEKGIRYKAYIITNGYFLTSDCSALFESCRICNAQITLDGPDAESHDRTRHLCSGAGTFDQIIHNLREFKGNCTFDIRCNVHKDNADSYPAMEERLLKIAKETGKEISVYAGHMDAHKDYADQEIGMKEYTAFKRKTMKKIGKVQYRGPVCMVPKLLEYVIDECGNLCKCLEDVGEDRQVIGNVRDFNPNDPCTGHMDRLTACFEYAWPGDDEECMSCPVLPVCMGGCPKRRQSGTKQCSGFKYALDEYVAEIGKELMNRDG